jgi:manganese oxidase
MFKKKKLLLLFSVVVSLAVLSGLLVGSSVASAQTVTSLYGQQITYNLYATDGWWLMADGTPIYGYGYIGGRTGEKIYPLDNNGKPLFPEGEKVMAPTPGPTGPEDVFAGHAQFPAPLIFCSVGDTVTITLKNLGVHNPESPPNPNDLVNLKDPSSGRHYKPNAPNDPHTIHLHGLDVDVANDGVPETSVAAVPANDSSQPGAGNVVVYVFKPKVTGTYFYHCHQEADIHVTMGMYGALIVYNRGEAGATRGPGYAGSLYNFRYARDVVMMLSDTDVRQHISEMNGTVVETGLPATSIPTANGLITTDVDDTGAPFYNPVDFNPQYWFINHLSFPDTVHAGASGIAYNDWLKAHPGYEPMIAGSVSKKDKVLVRTCNLGFDTAPMHCHGFHPKVLGSDQRAWTWANNPRVPTGKGLEKNTLLVGSGEEYDLLFDFSTVAVKSTYNPGTQTRYQATPTPTVTPAPPVANGQTGQPIIPAPPDNYPYIGGPTVKGVGAILPPTATVPAGVTGTLNLGQNNAPSQIFVYHNHDDYKATNNGLYPGGMFTVIVPLP